MNTVLENVKNNSIENVDKLRGSKVLLRIDVNVPLGSNHIVDPGEDWRIIQSFATINFLVEQGACVILISHIGREPGESLKPIFEYMSGHMKLGFLPNYDDQLISNTIDNMAHGSVVMLENLRQHPGEKLNDSSFLHSLIESCDLYVNDAFSVSHRKHASVHNITRYLPSYFGLQFCKEITFLEKTKNISTKSVLLLGGAKFGTKLDLLEQFLPKVSYALVGGALANVFLKARGFNVGESFIDDVDISQIIENEKIILPIDAIDQHGDVVSIDQFGDQDMILDIGPETEALFETIIDHADVVLWNGPMGKYEDGYTSGSIAVAESIARSGAFSVTGGGDTATVILQEDLKDRFDFISTGGGAMLDFLVQGTLPAIKIILENKDRQQIEKKNRKQIEHK